MTYKILLLVWISLSNFEVIAWGANGHRAVGQIATQHLNKKTKKKLAAILKDDPLAEVSTWMDDIKSDKAYDHTHDWHWVTIPDGEAYPETEKNPNGDIHEKIEEMIARLKSGKLTASEEVEALKHLIHLIGDIHQPLHVGRGDDAGGNQVDVTWFGDRSNLHRVWDSDMIESKQLSFTELVEFIDEPSKEEVKLWQSQPVTVWAMESIALRDRVYDLPENKKLGYEYLYRNFSTVKLRILQAGVRLAGVLNEIYG